MSERAERPQPPLRRGPPENKGWCPGGVNAARDGKQHWTGRIMFLTNTKGPFLSHSFGRGSALGYDRKLPKGGGGDSNPRLKTGELFAIGFLFSPRSETEMLGYAAILIIQLSSPLARRSAKSREKYRVLLLTRHAFTLETSMLGQMTRTH